MTKNNQQQNTIPSTKLGEVWQYLRTKTGTVLADFNHWNRT